MSLSVTSGGRASSVEVGEGGDISVTRASEVRDCGEVKRIKEREHRGITIRTDGVEP